MRTEERIKSLYPWEVRIVADDLLKPSQFYTETGLSDSMAILMRELTGKVSLPFAAIPGENIQREIGFQPFYQEEEVEHPRREGGSWVDTVVGDFEKGQYDYCELRNGARRLELVEAKVGSKLAQGTTFFREKWWTQAARTLAALASQLMKQRAPLADMQLGYTVVAPQGRIDAGIFYEPLQRPILLSAIDRRNRDFPVSAEAMEYVDEVFERLQIRLIAWEQVVEALMSAGAPESFDEYFELTLEHSKGGVKRVDKPSEGWACRVL